MIQTPKITIRTDIAPEQNQLWNLFCALDWHIGRTPEMVKIAFDNSSYVVTAWKDEQLVGVGRAISDGLFYTGVYDVLVHPEYQRRGIGTKIMREILTNFAGTSFLLTTTEDTDKFYERLGFRKTRNAMVIKRPAAE
jgi:GNAT superfamily N-acetyltransferase